jgi:hypothetical protein
MALMALFVSACGDRATPTRGDAGLLFLSDGSGLRAVRPQSGEVAFEAPGGLASFDWSHLYSARQTSDGTTLSRLDPMTGAIMSTSHFERDLTIRAVSHNGGMVALGPPHETGANYRPVPRSQTVLVVAADGGRVRRYVVPGNVEPEAFSVDTTSLFVLDFTPPTAPVRYQVRELELDTGKVIDVYSPDKDLQRAMGATARTQALSPDGMRLYTLYTLLDERASRERPAFVHVLDLGGKWAHCVHLPPPFGNTPDGPAAIAVSGDGHRLFAYDGSHGIVAEVDTVDLSVVRSAWANASSVAAVAASMAPGGPLVLAAGRRVVTLDPATLRRVRSWSVPHPVVAIQPAPDRRRLYVAFRDTVALLDADRGSEVRRIAVKGVNGISHIGSVPRPVSPNRGGYACAC